MAAPLLGLRFQVITQFLCTVCEVHLSGFRKTVLGFDQVDHCASPADEPAGRFRFGERRRTATHRSREIALHPLRCRRPRSNTPRVFDFV
jgi:hypothetical protein